MANINESDDSGEDLDIDPKTGNRTIRGSEERLEHPEQWRTGDDPPTVAQAEYIEGLAAQEGRDPDQIMEGVETKAEASEVIDDLRKETGLD